MRVLLIGATGVLGAVALPLLLASGHSVAASASSHANARRTEALGATPVDVDVFDPQSISAALARVGADALVNIATRIPSLAAAGMPGAWSANSRLRLEASVAAATACAVSDAEVFVQESVSFGYADGGDRELHEDAPTDFRSPIDTVPSCTSAAESVASTGRRGVCLLFGRFYGDEPRTREAIALTRSGRPALAGDPDGWAAPVHVESAASALVAALDAPSGAYNVNDPAIQKREIAQAYALAAGREPVYYSREVAELLPGVEIMARSQRTSAAAFERATGWSSPHPDFASSFAELTRSW